MNFRSHHKRDGFTLLEVLIAMVLLSIISLSIFEAITGSYRLRNTLHNEGDFYNTISLAIGILERDISQIYSPVIMAPETSSTSGESSDIDAIVAGDTNLATEFWGPAIDTTGIRPARLEGTQTSLLFVSASHTRIYKEAPESIFSKITYHLESNDDKESGLEGTQVLVKTENPNAFDLEEDEGDTLRVYPLLHGINNFKFMYYSKEKDRWESKWDTESADHKHIFPDIIRIEFELKGPGTLAFDGQYNLRPEIPLNGIHPSL